MNPYEETVWYEYSAKGEPTTIYELYPEGTKAEHEQGEDCWCQPLKAEEYRADELRNIKRIMHRTMKDVMQRAARSHESA